jgi:hypothetical protein
MEPWSAWQFFRRLIWKRNETLPIPSIVASCCARPWWRAPRAPPRTARRPTC